MSAVFALGSGWRKGGDIPVFLLPLHTAAHHWDGQGVLVPGLKVLPWFTCQTHQQIKERQPNATAFDSSACDIQELQGPQAKGQTLSTHSALDPQQSQPLCFSGLLIHSCPQETLL